MKKRNPKTIAILSHKMVCLTSMVLEKLDEFSPKTTSCEGDKKILTFYLEHVFEMVATCEVIKKDTYFQKLSNKLLDIIVSNDIDKTLKYEQHDLMTLCYMLRDTIEDMGAYTQKSLAFLISIDAFLISFFKDIEIDSNYINKYYLKEIKTKSDAMFRREFDDSK